MKNSWITILIFLAAWPATSLGQGNLKLYVYSQKVLPGVRQITATMGDPDVKDNTSPAKTNYLIYLWQKKATDVVPSEIWIEGKPYTITTENLEPGQRIPMGSPAEGNTLVPGGSARLLKLTLTGLGDGNQTRSKKLERCLRKHQAVLVFRFNGKIKMKGLKKILALESVPMQ